MTSYPPLPEWGPLDQEGLEDSSDEGVEVSNSSPPGATNDEDKGVEASTVKPRSAGTSLKRPRTPEGDVEFEDEDEVPLASRAAAAKRSSVRDSGSSASPKPSRVLQPMPLSMAPPARAKKPRAASAIWNLVDAIDLDDES